MSAVWSGKWRTLSLKTHTSLANHSQIADLLPATKTHVVGFRHASLIPPPSNRPQLPASQYQALSISRKSRVITTCGINNDFQAIQSKFSTGVQSQHAKSILTHSSAFWPFKKDIFKRQAKNVLLPGKNKTQPPQYKDRTFSQADINAAFGLGMDYTEGNRLLNMIQRQRVSGTIDEGVPGFRKTSRMALTWLRHRYPINEDAAILARFDREEARTYAPQINAEETGLYRPSLIDEMRKRNEAESKRREEEKKEKAAEELRNPRMTLAEVVNEALARPRSEPPAWVQEYRKKAEQDIPKIPEMNAFQRLGPATLATAAVIALAILFAQNYTPPSEAARMWPYVSPANATVAVCIGINFLVLLAWRVPQLWIPMNRNFLIVPALPKVTSLLGNIFSHQQGLHFLGNMVSLWIIGTRR